MHLSNHDYISSWNYVSGPLINQIDMAALEKIDVLKADMKPVIHLLTGIGSVAGYGFQILLLLCAA